MSLNELVLGAEGLAALITAGAFTWPIVKHFRRAEEKQERIFAAICGTPEQDGLPATPSVFSQIAAIQTTVAELTRDIDQRLNGIDGKIAEMGKLTKQLKPNDGHSLVDVVNRIEERTIRLEQGTTQ